MHAQEVEHELLARKNRQASQKVKMTCFAVYPQELSKRRKLKISPQEVTNVTAGHKKRKKLPESATRSFSYRI